jgi:hypothetical protein
VAGPALTPELALDYLAELSIDIRAGVVLDSGGELAASWENDPERGELVRELVRELLEEADGAPGGDGQPPSQVEVTTPRGAVFCVRDEEWTIAVVSGRFALSSLMFFDLRKLLDDLKASAA